MSRTTKYVEELISDRLRDMICDVGEKKIGKSSFV